MTSSREPDRALQHWFAGGALAAFIALLATAGTLGFAWYRAAVTEMESASTKSASATQRLKAEKIKELLGKAFAAGDSLIRNQSKDDAEKDMLAWATSVRDLIASAFGGAEAQLFLSNSGYTFYGDSSEKSDVRIFLDGRTRRISELLIRVERLTPQQEFDPKKFE